MNMMRALLLFCAISATLLASADNGVTFSSNRTDFRIKVMGVNVID